MSKIYGKAVIFGMDGVSIQMYGIFNAVGDLVLNSATFNDSFKLVPLLTDDGDTVGMKVSDRQATATIEMTPAGRNGRNTISAAKTMVQLPTPLALVRLYSFPDYLTGDWNYAGGGSFRMSKDGFGVLTLPLVRFQKVSARRMATVILRT